jgi:hypothetical protein
LFFHFIQTQILLEHRFVEAPALAPPECTISADEARALEQQLADAANAPLPDDDDEL